MTAFATKLASATFNTALKGLRLPSRAKLVGEYLLGVSQAESVKNRADPTTPLTVQGVPTYNAHSVTVRSSLSAGYGFLTGIIPNDDYTLICVRKPDTLGAAPVVVGSVDATGAMCGFTDRTAATNFFHNGESSVVDGAQRARPAGGTIFFEAGVASVQNPQLVTGGLGKLYYYSAGQQVATSAVVGISDRRVRPATCIGSNQLSDSVTNNTIEVFFVAIYQRTLSAAEIDAAYNAIVAYYATLGVTVV